LRNPHRIAIISQEFPPFTIGGIAAICYDLAYSLSKKGLPVTVFCGKSKSLHVQRLSKNLSVVRLPMLDLPPRHMWFQMRNFKSILKLLRSHTIVEGVDTKSSAVFAWFTKKLGKPFIAHLQGCPRSERIAFMNSPPSYRSFGDFVYYVAESPMNDFLTEMSLARSDHIVSCSHATFDEAREAYPHLDSAKASVIYNGINFDDLGPEKTEVEEDGSIVFHGRLVYIKGIVQLTKAMKIVKEKFPNAKLRVFGRGPLRDKIAKLVAESELGRNVVIQGHVPRSEIISRVRNASVIVLPSFYEAQSMAVLEAMSCRKPVVVLDLPFSREFIKDSYNGLLARPGDVDNLAEKISLCLSDRSLRLELGRNAYEHAKANHNWDVLVEQYIQLYDAVRN
jgi:glycosyltransferase involved in cell wall biosynthesis